MATHIHNGEFQVDPKTFFRGDLPNWAKVPKSGEHFYFTKLNGDSIYGGKHVDASHKKMGPHKEAMEEFVISLLGKLVNGKRQGGWLDEVKMSPIGGGAGGASYGSATIGGVDKRGGHEGGKLGPPAWFRSLRQKKEIEAARHILHGINKLMMDLAEDDTLGYSKKALAEMFASQKRYGSVMACEGSIYTSFQLNLVNFSVANDPEKFYHKKSEGLELHTDPGNDYSDISAKLELTLMPRGFCEARLYLPETGICYPGTQFSYSLFRGLATHFVAPPFLVDPAAFKQQNTDGPELREPNTEDAFGEIGPYCRLSIIAYRHGSPLRQHKPWYFLEVPYMAKLGAKVFRNDAKGADPYTQLLNDAALRELIELMNGQPASIVKRKELAYKLEKGKIIPKGTSKFLVGQSCFNSLPAIGTGSHSATGLLNWGGKRCALTLRTVRMKMGYAKAAEPKYATRLILHPEHMDITKMTDKELDKELERAGVWDAYVTDARKEQVERTKAKAARNSSKQNGAQAAKNVGNANGEKQDSGDNEVIEYDHHLVASFSRDIDRLKDLATDEQDANGNIIRKKWEHPLTPEEAMDEKNHEVHAEEVRKFLGDKPSTDAMLQNGVNMVNAARASKGLKPQTASQIWGKGEDTDDDSEEDNTAPNKSGAASRKKRKGKGGKGKGKGKQGNASDDDARDASDIDSDYDVKLDTSHPCNKGLIRMLRSLDSNADHTKCRCETQFGKQKGARVSDKKLKNLSSSAISTLYPVPPDEAQSSNNDAISKALSNLPADAHARRDAVRARLEGAAVVAEHARNANEISDQHDDALGFVRGVNNACRQSIQAVQMCRLALDATGRSSWSSFMRKGHSATEKEIEVEDWVISWLIAEGYLPETTQTGWSRRSSFRKKVNGMLRFHALAIGYGYRIHLLLDKHIFYTNLEYISDEFFEQWCNLAMAKLENVSNVKAHEQVKELHHRVQVRLASISKKLEAKWAGEMSQRFTNLFSKGPYSNVPILERS